MRKPPSKVCAINLGAVLDVVRFVWMGMGMGNKAKRAKSHYSKEFGKFQFQFSFDKFFQISRKDSIYLARNMGTGPLRMKTPPTSAGDSRWRRKYFISCQGWGGVPLFRTHVNSQGKQVTVTHSHFITAAHLVRVLVQVIENRLLNVDIVE